MNDPGMSEALMFCKYSLHDCLRALRQQNFAGLELVHEYGNVS